MWKGCRGVPVPWTDRHLGCVVCVLGHGSTVLVTAASRACEGFEQGWPAFFCLNLFEKCTQTTRGGARATVQTTFRVRKSVSRSTVPRCWACGQVESARVRSWVDRRFSALLSLKSELGRPVGVVTRPVFSRQVKERRKKNTTPFRADFQHTFVN